MLANKTKQKLKTPREVVESLLTEDAMDNAFDGLHADVDGFGCVASAAIEADRKGLRRVLKKAIEAVEDGKGSGDLREVLAELSAK